MSFERVLAHIHRAPVLAGMERMQPDMQTLATELLERFTLQETAPLPAAQEGAALALWGMDWRTDPATAFLEWHRSTGGVARALEVLLAALAFERRSYEWDSSIWVLAKARPAAGLSNLGVRPWLWMRRAMDAAAPADRAAAVEIANRASRAWHVRAALAFVFPDDDARWTPADRAELRHADVDRDYTAVRFGVLAAMRNAPIDHERLAQNYQINEAISPAEIAKSPDAVAALRLVRGYRQLAALGDPDGLRALLELADADEAWEVISTLPATAATIAALAPMFTTQRPRRLLGLHLAHGVLAELVTAAPDEAAQVKDPFVTSLLVATGARLPPDDAWVSPWAKPTKAKKSKKLVEVAPVLNEVAFDDRIHWKRGEREQHAQTHEREGENMDAEIEKRTLMQARHDKAFAGQLVWVGDETTLKLWKAIEPARWYAQTDDLEHLLARFGEPLLDSVIAYVRTKPDTMAALSRVESPKVAPVMARGFALVKKMEKVGRAWLEEFPEAAALGLLRDVDGDKKQRDANAKALAHVAAKFPAIVEDVTARLGAGAKATELTAAGAPQLPARAPKLPDFIDLARLPRPIVDGKALQGAALGEFVQLLAVPGAPDPSRYDDDSLARFAWSVFRQWLFAGAPPKHKWAMYAVGRFPDDDNAKALGRLARVWAPRGNSARAQEAVEVLATMRTQTGLIEIHEIASKVQSKALKARAEAVFESVAKSLGLGIEELADRLVPELSEADLTFGDLRVELDTSLVPRLVASDGTTVEKPRDADDLVRWKALEKMCKTVARTQLARLEQILADGHRIPYAHFSEIYLMHSLIRHLARGLVWGAYRDGKLERAFAIAADGPIGIDGAPLELAIDAAYGVVHPVELSVAERLAWQPRVTQPFLQLAREVFPADSGVEVTLILARLINRVIVTGRLLELQRRGWRRGDSPQGGRYYSIDRAGAGWSAELAFLPGIYLGKPNEEPTQALEAVAFFAEPDVPKAVLSEIQRDVRGLLAD